MDDSPRDDSDIPSLSSSQIVVCRPDGAAATEKEMMSMMFSNTFLGQRD